MIPTTYLLFIFPAILSAFDRSSVIDDRVNVTCVSNVDIRY